MPRRNREAPDSPAIQELDAAVEAYAAAEQRLKSAIVGAAREAIQDGSKLTFAAIGRRANFSREYVYRLAAEAGIKRPPTRGVE